MHWLPLVAMVIASALPFPYSPVTRIVAATTETSSGSHDDGSGSGSGGSSGGGSSGGGSSGGGSSGGGSSLRPPRPLVAPPPPHNCSDGKDTYPPAPSGPGRPAPPEEEVRTGRAGRDGGRAAGSPYRDAVPGASSPGEPRGTPDFSCDHANANANVNAPAGVAVTRDDRPGPAAADDDARDSTRRKENLREQSPGEEARVSTETGAGEGRSSAGARGRPGGPGSRDEPGELALDGVQEVDELFLDAHPRVLFSPSASPPRHPPLLLMLESGALPDGEGGGAGAGESNAGYDPLGDGGEGAAAPSWAAAAAALAAGGGGRRTKRSDLSDLRRGERSVCESENVWVTDKKTAVDNHGRTVTILPVIQTPTGPLRQYFFETRCRRGEGQQGPAAAAGPSRGGSSSSSSRATGAEAGLGLGVAGSGCLGVDKKQWKSECKAKHSFVRALAKDASNRMGWRWIRIDSSCVCVLLARVSRQAGGKV